MHRFTLDAQIRADFEAAIWFTSTHSGSRFTQNLIVCRVVGDNRVNLLNSSLSVWQPNGRVEQRALADAHGIGNSVRGNHGLALPASAEII
jgi:N-hydroxyarylamine O-acetyltransferase